MPGDGQFSRRVISGSLGGASAGWLPARAPLGKRRVTAQTMIGNRENRFIVSSSSVWVGCVAGYP